MDWICCQDELLLCKKLASSTQIFPFYCSNDRNVPLQQCTSGPTAELTFLLPDPSQHAAGQILKKAFSITYRGIIQHIINVRAGDTVSGLFCTPSGDPCLKTIIPRHELVEQLDSKTFSIISVLRTSSAADKQK